VGWRGGKSKFVGGFEDNPYGLHKVRWVAISQHADKGNEFLISYLSLGETG